MKLIQIAILIILVSSCVGTEEKSLNQNSQKSDSEWCKHLVYGDYEANVEGVKVKVRFGKSQDGGWQLIDEGFTIAYELGEENYIDGERYIKSIVPISTKTGFSFMELFEMEASKIKLTVKQSFFCDGVGIYDGEGGGKEIFSDEQNFSKVEIKILDNKTIELSFNSIRNLLKENFNLSVSDKINKVVLKKEYGEERCFDFNPDVSFEKFTQDEKSFIYHDVEAENLTRLSKSEMLDYCFMNSFYFKWNKDLEKYGTVFKIDFNNDGEQDICGYFKSGSEIENNYYFKIFLNNGVTYNDIYTVDLFDTEGNIKPVLSPAKLKGKNVLQINYVNDPDYTNYLYFDKLENKVKDYITD